MADVISRQVGQRRYGGGHPIARAIGPSAAEKSALIEAARSSGGRIVIDEGSPPHLHIQF